MHLLNKNKEMKDMKTMLFASVFAVALLVGGIYLIATGHPSGGYALAGASVFTGLVVMALVSVAAVRFAKEKRKMNKKVKLMFVAACLVAGIADSAFAEMVRPVPSAALMERLRSEEDVIGIVHWGLNTYTDREWGYGDENPKDLNPAKFDADQIAQACADGGLKGLVVVAKHHDGFCLWPTKTTEHNITKSPFRDGKGDYVREMADACRKAE